MPAGARAGRHVLPEVGHHLGRLAGPGAQGQALGREAPLAAQGQEGTPPSPTLHSIYISFSLHLFLS